MRRPRSQPGGDVDTVDVLLVEDEEDVAADEVRTVLRELALEAMARRATWAGEPQPDPDQEAALERPEPPGLARRLVRRYRGRMVAAAVLAVAVTATTAVVDARQTAARAAALAASPAVLAAAPGPPAEVWRVPGRVVSDQHDLLLVVDDASLRAIDPATGEVTWTASSAAGRAAAGGGCFPVDEGLRPDRAPADGAGPPGLVACVTHAPAGTPDGDPTAGARVVVVDGGTGRTRHTVTADGALLAAEPVGRDLLVVDALPDGRVRVTRWDLAAGAPRWDRVSPLPVLAGGGPDAVRRRPGSLTVGDFAVDLATGDSLDPEAENEEPYPYQEHVLPGGARAVWGWREGGASGRGRVLGGDAGSWYFLPGPPLRPSVTDGSDGGVLLVRIPQRERLRGLDLRTGRMRWTQPYPGASALRATALVDGVMVLDGDAGVTALDVRTGDVRWHTPGNADLADGTALTDGRVVLLPLRADDGAVHLVARRIADGQEVWRTEAPAGTVSTTVVDHRLVASTENEVVGLG